MGCLVRLCHAKEAQGLNFGPEPGVFLHACFAMIHMRFGRATIAVKSHHVWGTSHPAPKHTSCVLLQFGIADRIAPILPVILNYPSVKGTSGSVL